VRAVRRALGRASAMATQGSPDQRIAHDCIRPRRDFRNAAGHKLRDRRLTGSLATATTSGVSPTRPRSSDFCIRTPAGRRRSPTALSMSSSRGRSFVTGEPRSGLPAAARRAEMCAHCAILLATASSPTAGAVPTQSLGSGGPGVADARSPQRASDQRRLSLDAGVLARLSVAVLASHAIKA
jgi:hypothetical protein